MGVDIDFAILELHAFATWNLVDGFGIVKAARPSHHLELHFFGVDSSAISREHFSLLFAKVKLTSLFSFIYLIKKKRTFRTILNHSASHVFTYADNTNQTPIIVIVGAIYRFVKGIKFSILTNTIEWKVLGLT